MYTDNYFRSTLRASSAIPLHAIKYWSLLPMHLGPVQSCYVNLIHNLFVFVLHPHLPTPTL